MRATFYVVIDGVIIACFCLVTFGNAVRTNKVPVHPATKQHIFFPGFGYTSSMKKKWPILFIFVIIAWIIWHIISGSTTSDGTSPTAMQTKNNSTFSRESNKSGSQTRHMTGDRIVHALKTLVRSEPTPSSLAESLETIGAKTGDPVFIRIFKAESELELWIRHGKRFHLLQTYPVCAWSGELGPKLREGDGQSPEGFYFVTRSRLNPNSRFHLAFNLGFPNRYDRAHGRTGSFLMVHGGCASTGCYAMTDRGIETIYTLVEQALLHGQKIVRVHIFPFRMTKENMAHYHGTKWMEFWRNLKEGYDLFEQNKIPPNVTVIHQRYFFEP